MAATMTFPRSADRLRGLRPVLLTIVLLGVLSCSAPAGSQPAQRGRIDHVEIPAPALAGNLLGSATVQQAAVYLPPGYGLDSERRYPAIYLLHGIFDRYQTWLDVFSVPAILDRLVASGDVQELIVVMPDGVNQFGGGFYRNSPVSGNWADFIADDLVDYVDGHYRTLDRVESRAITGHSMGGYGALHLGMTRPDVFSVVWAMSPCCLAAVDDLGFGNDAWRRATRFESPEQVQAALQGGDFYPVAAIGLLTAFSPAPDNPPLYVDFPFEVVRGETLLVDAEYDRYLDALPVRQLDEHREALRGLRGLALDVGLRDQFLHIPTGTVELAQRLGQQRIPHLLDVYDGDHRELIQPRLEEIVFPWIAARLAGPGG